MSTLLFPFPGEASFSALIQAFSQINGRGSFEKKQEWEADVWTVDIQVSRGSVLEKAGIGQVIMRGGQVEGIPTDIQLLQTLAWPAHPTAPGFIIMASTSRMQDQPSMIMLYVDLIQQGPALDAADCEAFSAALREVCSTYNQNWDDLQSMLVGRGMLGACAAACGLLYFFEETDIPFLEEVIEKSLSAYQRIVARDRGSATDKDRMEMVVARKKILDWILSEDYGVKVARQNDIPLEIMELYAFPPGMSLPS